MILNILRILKNYSYSKDFFNRSYVIGESFRIKRGRTEAKREVRSVQSGQRQTQEQGKKQNLCVEHRFRAWEEQD